MKKGKKPKIDKSFFGGCEWGTGGLPHIFSSARYTAKQQVVSLATERTLNRVIVLKKHSTQKRFLLYNIFNNVIYFSISSFFKQQYPQNINSARKHELWHIREQLQKIDIFSIVKAKKDTYTVCIHRRSEQKWKKMGLGRQGSVWGQTLQVRSLDLPSLV